MNSSVMIDLVIGGILIALTYLGWRRGLFRSLAELAVMVLALVLSAQIASAAAPEIVDRALRPATYAAIEQQVDEMLAENVQNLSPLEEMERVVEAIPNEFVRKQALGLLDGLGLSTDRTLSATARETLIKLGRQAADAALDGVVRRVIHSLVCGVSFAVLTFALRLAIRVLAVLTRLPGVRQLNEAGGALLGLGKGLLLVCLAVWILGRTGVVTREMAEGSLLLGRLAAWTGAFGGVSV